MRIGLLASVGHMVDSFFTEIIDTWIAAGHSVSVAAGTPTADGTGVVIAGLGRRPGPGAVAAWAGLRRWARSQRLDVVVTNSATASALVRTARLPVPVVYFCHGLHWNSGTALSDRVWQQVEQTLLRRTDGVIAINSDDHAWFGQRFDPQRLLRLPSGVGLDLERYRAGDPQQRLGDDDRLELVWIGEFSERKRPNRALDVVLALESLGVDVRLRMVGDGPLRSAVAERIRRLGLSGQVTADGPDSVVDALTRSHGLLHTSAWEGLPRVMLEAVAVGRRPYAFDVKGVRDVPEAVLATDGDVAGLAAAIRSDWVSGRMTAPLVFDRTRLDYRLTGDAVRSFLEGLTGRRTASQGVR